jgi:hypothetical protein
MVGRSVDRRHSQADKTVTTNSSYQPMRGCQFLHTAIDAHSRLAYSQLSTDERK